MEEHPLCQNTPAVYRPSQPAELLLYRLLSDYFHSFEQVYDVRFVREYGIYRPVISDVVRAYLKCGDLNIGIRSCTLYQLSLRVPACLFLPGPLVSESRSSLTCSSCHAKKVIQLGELLRESILYPLLHRQYVFSIPIILRKYFLYNRKLLFRLCPCAAESLRTFLRTVSKLGDGVVGAVLTIQTSGKHCSSDN